MKKIDIPHDWNLSPSLARELQLELAGHVRLEKIKKTPGYVAGMDCSLDKRAGKIFAAAVVFSFPQLEWVETATAVRPLDFPYVPGLLSFREAPVCLAAAEKVTHKVDLWLIDGQGIAHPRRLGLASHLGLFLNAPTIGCAKSRLIGTYEEPGIEKGSYNPLYQKEEPIGAIVRTRDNVKPLFISSGHLCTIDDAIHYTLACTTNYRLPEPTRIAHQTVSKIKTTKVTE